MHFNALSMRWKRRWRQSREGRRLGVRAVYEAGSREACSWLMFEGTSAVIARFPQPRVLSTNASMRCCTASGESSVCLTLAANTYIEASWPSLAITSTWFYQTCLKTDLHRGRLDPLTAEFWRG